MSGDHCALCGDRMRYCVRCRPAEFNAAVAALLPWARTAVRSPPDPFRMCATCEHCGAQRARRDGFCGKCGHKPEVRPDLYESYQMLGTA